MVDRPAPTIEHPAKPITSASDRPEPAGYGAIGSHWHPRSERVGTYDDAWRKTRMPLLPLDFDPRFFDVAHPPLQFERGFRSGDAFSLLGIGAESRTCREAAAATVSEGVVGAAACSIV